MDYTQSKDENLSMEIECHKELYDFLLTKSTLTVNRVSRPLPSLDGTCLQDEVDSCFSRTSRPASISSGTAASETLVDGKLGSLGTAGNDLFMAIDAEAAAFLDADSIDESPFTKFTKRTSSESETDVVDRQHVTSLLLSTSEVRQVCLVKPRAGPFEGRLVALVIAATDTSLYSSGIKLISEAEHLKGRQLAQKLRAAVFEWGGDAPCPSIWVFLRSMALDNSGSPDVRRLQTWIQNVTEELTHQIFGMQPPEPQPQPPLPQVCESHGDTSQRALWRETFEYQRYDRLSLPVANDASPGLASDGSDFFPLSAMQQLFFSTSMNRSIEMAAVSDSEFRYSQSVLLEAHRDIPLAEIEAAVNVLTSRHAMLRARFRLTGEGWAQVIAPTTTSPYHFDHRVARNDDEIIAAIEHAQSCLNVFRGPVFAVQHIRKKDDTQLLYLVAHHLVVDLRSWRILLRDLDELLKVGTLFSEASIPFTKWTEHEGFENSQRLFQPPVPFLVSPSDLSYWNLERQTNYYGDSEKLSFFIAPGAASALRSTCNQVFDSETSDILLASLLHSFCHAFPDRDAPTIWKQESGRESSHEGFNIAETVGWFNLLRPISLSVESDNDLLRFIKRVKDTRESTSRDCAHFLTSLLVSAEMTSISLPVEIIFRCNEPISHPGVDDALLCPVAVPGENSKSISHNVGPGVGRIAIFEVSVDFQEQGANIDLRFNSMSAHRDLVSLWVELFERSISECVRRLAALEPGLESLESKSLLHGVSDQTAACLTTAGLTDVTNIENICSVSPIQEEILISQQIDEAAYEVSNTYELLSFNQEPIDQTRLCEAWNWLVASRSSLRSVFISGASENVLFDQIVLKKVSPLMLFIDSSDPVKALATIPPMKAKPSIPQHRLTVCRSSTQTFVRIDVNQALCDPLSLHSLIFRLRHICAWDNPFLGDSPDTLARNIPISSLPASLTEIWRKQAKNFSPCLFPRLTLDPPEQAQSRGFDMNVLPRQLDEYCVRLNVRPESVIKLAWALVLRVFTGEDQVAFGFLHSGRDQMHKTGRFPSIGSFAGLLPVFIDIKSDKIIPEIAKEINKTADEFEDIKLPTISAIQHLLRIPGNSLFNSCISFHEATSIFSRQENLPSESWRPAIFSTSFCADADLSLSLTSFGNSLRTDITYRHLSASQACNVVNSFERALQIIIDSEKQRISDVDLFTNHDYRQLTSLHSPSTDLDLEKTVCIHEQILRHAFQNWTPVAISSMDGDVTYLQLYAYVSKVAIHLMDLGVKPGTMVPVVLTKSALSPIIMLAVLQAGACFVSLDSRDADSARILIRQLDAEFVVTSDTIWKQNEKSVKKCILITRAFIESLLLPPGITNERPKPKPSQGACAFLSPGKCQPEGISFSHRALHMALAAQGPALRLSSSSRVLQLSAFSNDTSLVETLGVLLHGGCICVPPAWDKIQDLEGPISKMGVNWSYMTLAVARRIDPAKVPSLKTICFRTRNFVQEAYPSWVDGDREILLAYGAPDVCPLAISVHRIYGRDDINLIAPPLSGRFLIIDPSDTKKLLPIGAVGELAIDKPTIAADKYVHGQSTLESDFDSMSLGKRKKRFMRTGHRARFLEHGYVRFLGSNADDIVISGKSFSIAAIERSIRPCLPRTIDVVVKYITSCDSVSVLAAFLELKEETSCDVRDLRGTLPCAVKKRLHSIRRAVEDAMEVRNERDRGITRTCPPSVYIPIREFPLTTSFKVHKRKLQQIASSMTIAQLLSLADGKYDGAQSITLDDKPLPLTQTEESMRGIWAAILGSKDIDIRPTQSFLDAGGDRFSASKLVVACRKEGLDVSIGEVLRGSTLTYLCRIRSATRECFRRSGTVQSDASSLGAKTHSELHESLIRDSLAPQMGVSFEDISSVSEASSHQIQCLESSLYHRRGDINTLVLHFNGVMPVQKLSAACHLLTKTHTILRTGFATRGCNVFQLTLKHFYAEFVHQLCLPRDLSRLTKQVVTDNQMLRLRLGDPATKFTFMDAGDQGELLLRYSTAQMASSVVAQLVQDFILLFTDPDHVLPRPSFLNYVQVLQDAGFSSSTRFWRKRLEGVKMTRLLPNPDPSGPTNDYATLHDVLEVTSLHDLEIHFDSVLKTAWAIVLASLTGESDVVFGELLEERCTMLETNVETWSIVGPMDNTIPIRIRLRPSCSSPIQMIHTVQGACAASVPYEGLGMREIVKRCTDWPAWTKFSTVVRHRTHLQRDGSTTLNIGDTTFTYRVVESECRDMPDFLVTSTLKSPGKAALALSFPYRRIAHDYAEMVLRLLMMTIRRLMNRQTITQPILPPASKFERKTPWLPQLERGEGAREEETRPKWLPAHHRNTLKTFLLSIWKEVLCSNMSDPVGEQSINSPFYESSGCLVPAYFLAQRVNSGLPLLRISGWDIVHVSAEELIENPTITSQIDLIARKLHALGLVSSSATKSKGRDLNYSTTSVERLALTRYSSRLPPANQDHSRRDSSSSIRDLSTRASGWWKHRLSRSRDKQAPSKSLWPRSSPSPDRGS